MAKNPNAPAAGATKPEDTKKPVEKVEVDKATLDAVLTRLENLETEGKKKDEQIEMLKEIADKGRLSRYEQENSDGELIPVARIAFWEESPILAWKLVKDEVGFRDGRLIVSQVVRLFLDVGEKEPKTVEVEYLYWTQNVRSNSGEVVSKTETKEGKFWTVQMKDGKKITVDVRFINAF